MHQDILVVLMLTAETRPTQTPHGSRVAPPAIPRRSQEIPLVIGALPGHADQAPKHRNQWEHRQMAAAT